MYFRQLNTLLNKLPLRLFFWMVVITLTITISAWNLYIENTVLTQPELSVSFLSVGQGDAIYIRTPSGSDALIDAGPGSKTIQELSRVMPQNDTNLDLLIITHPDQDHIGGLATIFDSYEIKNLLTTEKKSSTKTFQAITQKISTEPGIRTTLARAGQRIILDPDYGVYIDVLFPHKSAETIKDTNEASIVLELVYGESEFLLTGDAPASVENYLVRVAPEAITTDVLKLGHHGSKTSSSDEFLTATGARYAVVSAGKNNKYGHPHAEVTERVQLHAMQLLSTIDGTITFTTDGVSINQKTP